MSSRIWLDFIQLCCSCSAVCVSSSFYSMRSHAWPVKLNLAQRKFEATTEDKPSKCWCCCKEATNSRERSHLVQVAGKSQVSFSSKRWLELSQWLESTSPLHTRLHVLTVKFFPQHERSTISSFKLLQNFTRSQKSWPSTFRIENVITSSFSSYSKCLWNSVILRAKKSWVRAEKTQNHVLSFHSDLDLWVEGAVGADTEDISSLIRHSWETESTRAGCTDKTGKT